MRLGPTGNSQHFWELMFVLFYFQHVYGRDHSQFAENDENFRHMDQLLGQIPNFADVVANLERQRSQMASPNLSPGNLYDARMKTPSATSRSRLRSPSKVPDVSPSNAVSAQPQTVRPRKSNRYLIYC